MYTIYWMDKNNNDWTENKVYITKKLAIKFLEKQGYRLKDGWHRRCEVGWEGETRALVEKAMIVNTKENAKLTWKTKLGLSACIQDQNVVSYLSNFGFEESKLQPEFSGEETNVKKIKSLGSECLVLKGKEPFSDVEYTIYITDQEAYVERKTDKYESSKYIKTDESLSMNNIDVILNKIL